MDFLSQYRAYKFQRNTTVFTKGAVTASTGTVTTMGGAFILLSSNIVGGNPPCRLRLYSDQTSRDLDINRPYGNFNLTESVRLITDIVLTSTTRLPLNPPIIGNTVSAGEVWYHLSGSNSPVSVEIQSYPIKTVFDSIDGNTNIIISGSSIPTTGYGVSGSITTSKSFIILSGSASAKSRLRIYSRPVNEVPLSEATRSFGTQSRDGSLLIADLMFDSASFSYPLVPVLEGYTWLNENYVDSSGQVGYILQNTSGGTTDVTASLYIYSTED